MIIGVPKEIKVRDDRVAITPFGASNIIKKGHKVFIEKSAGLGSGFSDDDYKKVGAHICEETEEVYANADIIIKIEKPQPSEYKFLKKNQILMTFLHLATEKELTKELLAKKVTSIGYETIQLQNGKLPLLIPLSEIAGKMSIQIAANLLENRNKGAGILLGGVPGVPAGKVLIVGAGTVGFNAVKVAVGMGANVCVVDVDINKLRYIDDIFGSKVKTYVSSEDLLKELVPYSDVIIGAALIPGHRTPRIITEEMVKSMKKGSVIVDVSVDQGGVVETIDRITDIDNPSFIKHGVIHYCVPNMTGSVARTSTIAFANESIKYVLSILDNGIVDAIKTDKALASGINTFNGKLTNEGVAKALDMEYVEIPTLIGF